MGKMRIGKGAPVKRSKSLEIKGFDKKAETPLFPQLIGVEGLKNDTAYIVSPEILERLSKLETDFGKPRAEVTVDVPALLPPVKTVEKVVEKLETRTEVSVITKDKRSRKHSLLVSERLDLLSHKLKMSDTLHEGHSIEIRDLQEYCGKLERELCELRAAEKALEAQIPEEKQEVRVPGLVYLGVTASILLSILGLILK